MPFVVGVLKTDLEEVLRNPMDEVLLVDLDNDSFILTPSANPTDDLDLIPPSYTENLKKLIRVTAKTIKSL